MLLARPNDRYLTLKKIIQRSEEATNPEDIFSGMRDDDADYEANYGSARPGSAALAEAVKIEVQKVEISWAQKSNSGRPAGGRPAT